MKYPLLCLVALVLFSCKKEEKKEVQIPQKEVQANVETDENAPDVPDTLKIKYDEHKNLFTILTILPDSSFSSWEWPKNDRIELVNKVKKNNYIVATRFLWKYSLITPNALQIAVVDGSWVLSIYKVKTNNYIVLAENRVGDGSTFRAFEYENGQLTAIPFNDLFDHSTTELLIDPDDEKCMEYFNDNRLLFDYSYIGTKKIKVHNYYLEEYKDCFKGNTMNYEFDPAAKMFKLINIEFSSEK
ncbi:hypothetical protein ACFFLS_06285 [Flavobacterium procerum]|uniref:Lipoprotein n=1 Tax=Flavobacterium procerum TaxID=1455569 RepID=A0ABV6BPV5_9FLAO